MDGPAAPPESGWHLCAPDAARWQVQVPAGRAALYPLHPQHLQPLPRVGAAAAPDRSVGKHPATVWLCLRAHVDPPGNLSKNIASFAIFQWVSDIKHPEMLISKRNQL